MNKISISIPYSDGSGMKMATEEYENMGDVSDGYHTFNELYEHRTALFAALLRTLRQSRKPHNTWKSKFHDDGTMYEGYFIAGCDTPAGEVGYHMPLKYWDWFSTIPEREKAPPYKGYKPADVIGRLGSI